MPIESIEKGIRDSSICLADITTDNPNVWYELGFAFAAGKSVVMVCSDERKGSRFPFDIQHRTVIKYQSESSSDFEQLQREIMDRIKALLTKGEQLRQLAESDSVAPREGLTQPELVVLVVLAGENDMSEWQLKNAVERAGFTAIGFKLGLRRLQTKGFVGSDTRTDETDGYDYTAMWLTSVAWDWIEANEHLFVLKRGNDQQDYSKDDQP